MSYIHRCLFSGEEEEIETDFCDDCAFIEEEIERDKEICRCRRVNPGRGV